MTEPAVLPAPASVSPEVLGFLTHFAVALHKLRAYPTGHPMRHAALTAAYRALGDLLAAEPVLRIGVARQQLVVGEAATDPGHFMLRDMALRLHRRQVGSVEFRAGIDETTFANLVEALSNEPKGQRGEPAFKPLEINLPALEVSPIALSALSLGGGDDDPVRKIDLLWQELAQLIGGAEYGGGGVGGDGGGGAGSDGAGTGGWGGGEGGGGGPAVGLVGSTAMAQALLERLAAPEARAALSGTVERLGRLAQTLDGDARRRVEARLRDLLATLPKEALSVLLNIDLGRRDGLGNLLPAVEWLPAMALIELVEGAARAQNQEISGVFLRLLRKLAKQGGGPTVRRVGSDRDLRATVRSLLADWTLTDPNSKSHRHILEVLARHDPVSAGETSTLDESFRLVQMAVETDTAGDHVVEAVEQATSTAQLPPVLDLLANAGVESVAGACIRGALVSPGNLRRILHDARIDSGLLDQVLGHAGPEAAPILIDRLLSLDDREIRRLVAERLFAMGPTVSLEVFRRIEAVGPNERRALLELLTSLPNLPEGFSARAYLESPDPLIRLEAYRLMMRRAEERDEAIYLALADDDERVVRIAIDAGRERMPRQSLTRLMLLLNSSRRKVELRARAVDILRQFDGLSIREWLLSGLLTKGGWFRRRKLAPKTPLVVAKLTVLAARWANHPDTARVLELARQSNDPEVQQAVRQEEPST